MADLILLPVPPSEAGKVLDPLVLALVRAIRAVEEPTTSASGAEVADACDEVAA